MKPLCLLFCLGLTLLPASSVFAQCRLEGVLLLADGTPLAGAVVRLEGQDYRQPLTTTTDSQGHYAFPAVKPGIRVRVVAIQDGSPIAEGFALVTLPIERLDLREEARSPDSNEYVFASEGPSGEVAGVVTAADGSLVPAARITVGESSVSTTADSSGRYVIGRLRPGLRVNLYAEAPGFQILSKPVTITGRNRLQVDFTLDPQPLDDGADAQLLKLDVPADGGRIEARAETIARVPSLVRNDVFRALEFLPSVAPGMQPASELYVRGGTPDQTLVTVDGFHVYQFGDALGVLSPYNMDTIERAGFSVSPLDASGGGRLSGALDLASRRRPARATGFADFSVLGVNGMVDAPLGDRFSVLIAGRKSPPASLYNDVLDNFAATSGVPVRERDPRYSGGALTNASTLSRFYDLNTSVAGHITDKDRITASFYNGHTDANASRDLSNTPTQTTGLVPLDQVLETPSDAVVQVSQAAEWTSRGLGGTWVRKWNASASTTVSVGQSDYSGSGAQAWLPTTPSDGKDYSYADSGGGSAGLTETNHVRDTTVRANGSVAVGFAHALSLGAELSSLETSYASQTETGHREGSTSASSLAGLLDRTDEGQLTSVHAEDAWRPLTPLIVSPGLRVTWYDRTGSAYLEPRVKATYELRPGLRFNGAWSIDHQMISRITREDRLHGDGSFWSLADGVDVPVMRASQIAFGSSLDLPEVTVRLEAYSRQIEDTTLFAPRLFPGVAPAPGSTLFYQGSTTTRGIESSVQHKAERNALWISFTVSKAESTYPALEADTFPASWDQRQAFKMADTFQIAPGWSVSGAWVMASGRPYTPASEVQLVWFPSGTSVYEVQFGAKNSARLPPYHRLDLSSERDWLVRGMKLSVGGTVFNVYDHTNVLYKDYEAIARTITSYDVTLMGLAVNAFVRIGF